jgi:hypothetical protein
MLFPRNGPKPALAKLNKPLSLRDYPKA